MGRVRPRIAAGAAFVLVIIATAAMVDRATTSHVEDRRASATRDLDVLASRIDAIVSVHASGAETLASLVTSTGLESQDIDAGFPTWADALMDGNPAILSIQLAPDSVLDYVFPVEGNEKAVGLELMADPMRRALLEPTIANGQTSVQGPVTLVQGGLGLIVRHPVYDGDDFWGFAAVVLDWPTVVDDGQLRPPPGQLFGVRDAATGEARFGFESAFDGDPVYTTRAVGGTETMWLFAEQPIDGWEAGAETGVTWVLGLVMSALVAVIAHQLVRRPALLDEQRQAAVRELARSEARFQTMFESAGVGIVIIGADGLVTSANPAFEGIIRGQEWSFDHDPSLLIDIEDRQRFRRAMIDVRRGGAPRSVEVRLSGSGMVPRWVRVSATAVRGQQSLIGVVEDVTDRVLAGTALAGSEERFRLLTEHSPIGIQREDHSATKELVDNLRAKGVDDAAGWLADRPEALETLLWNVFVVDTNPAADALQVRLGSEPGPGRLGSRFPNGEYHSYLETVRKIADGASVTEHSSVAPTDVDDVHLQITWHAPEGPNGPDYSQLLVTLRDVSDLVKVQEELELEIASRDRFIASVAHELRTPLTAVVGFAHELRNDDDVYDENDRQEFVDLIAHHSSELSHLIEDLLVWARADIGEVDVRLQDVSLARAVRQTVASLPDVDLPVVVDGDPVALADPTRLAQIVRNLATNCVRYGGPDRRVDVRVEDAHAFVEVSDDGPPLPEDRLARVFAPYERAVGSGSLPGSIGLGLTVSRTLAHLQGGDLTVERRGDRTVFQLSLPLAPQRVS